MGVPRVMVTSGECHLRMKATIPPTTAGEVHCGLVADNSGVVPQKEWCPRKEDQTQGQAYVLKRVAYCFSRWLQPESAEITNQVTVWSHYLTPSTLRFCCLEGNPRNDKAQTKNPQMSFSGKRKVQSIRETCRNLPYTDLGGLHPSQGRPRIRS